MVETILSVDVKGLKKLEVTDNLGVNIFIGLEAIKVSNFVKV